MKLKDYIDKHYRGNQAAFARSQGVTAQAVTKWINKGYIVIGDDILGPVRKLVRAEPAQEEIEASHE